MTKINVFFQFYSFFWFFFHKRIFLFRLISAVSQENLGCKLKINITKIGKMLKFENFLIIFSQISIEKVVDGLLNNEEDYNHIFVRRL